MKFSRSVLLTACCLGSSHAFVPDTSSASSLLRRRDSRQASPSSSSASSRAPAPASFLRPLSDEHPATATALSKQRYSSEDWFQNLASIPKSKIYRRISSHLVSNTAWAAAITALHDYSPVWFQDIPTLPHTVLASALSLLLVFRTNASYDRWWEARKVWGAIVNKSREMATFVFSATDPSYHRTLGAFVCLSPFVMKQHLQGIRDPPEVLRILEDFGIELTEQEKTWLFEQENIPLIVFKFEQEAMKAALRGGRIPDGSDGRNRFLQKNFSRAPSRKEGKGKKGDSYTVALPPPKDGVPFYGDIEYSTMYAVPMIVRSQQMVGDMIDNLGKCERILKSPVPLSYSRHTSRLLSIFCATLPLALVSKFGDWTVAAMLMVAWGLFAIEEIGHFIEEPFSAETNVLALPSICSTIERGVKGVLSDNDVWDCGEADAASVNYLAGGSGKLGMQPGGGPAPFQGPSMHLEIPKWPGFTQNELGDTDASEPEGEGEEERQGEETDLKETVQSG